MVSRINTSPLPALIHAVRALEAAQRSGGCLDPSLLTQRLHTFGGCTYTVRLSPSPGATAVGAAEQKRPSLDDPVAAANSLPDSTETNEERRASRWGTALQQPSSSSSSSSATATGGAGESSAPLDARQGVHCTSTIHLTFRHAIPFSQLRSCSSWYPRLVHQLHETAPHCRLITDGVTLDVCIPADTPPAERATALDWAARLRVLVLIPAITHLLQLSEEAEDRQCLELCPTIEEKEVTVDDDTDKTPLPTGVSAQAVSHALFINATPAPSLACDATQTKRAKDGVVFRGTLMLSTCVAVESARDAIFARRYLEAFADASSATPAILLVVRESPLQQQQQERQPPRDLRLSSRWSTLPRSWHIWWCTVMLGPHQLKSEGALEKAVGVCLRLRQTVLFHVHHERMALNCLLRQQLASYAAQFQ